MREKTHFCMPISQNLDLFCESISIFFCAIFHHAFRRIFFRAFLFMDSFVAHFIVPLLLGKFGWLSLQDRDKFNLQRVVGEEQIGCGYFPQMLLFFSKSVTLSGLFKIC